MPPRNEPRLLGAEDMLSAISDSGQALRQQYSDDPVGLAERFHLRLPEKPVITMIERGVISAEEAEKRFGTIEPGLRDLVVEVCTGQVESAAVVGPRGGGKSQGVSFIEFFMVFIKMYDALNLGGSELQADQVYQYLLAYIQNDKYWDTLIKGKPMKERTNTTDNAWIRVLTASPKSVRSPHAGGRKPGGRMAGGILVIDEEAEAEEDIVSAALFTINTAVPSVNVRSSTFHNAAGSFADLIDNHEEMGYKLFGWDVFDVCAGCDCPADPTGQALCMSDEKCFREDHIEKYPDPETGEEVERVVHRAYCGGRARYGTGWVPMSEIVKIWRRIKRNHTIWEVEQMGSRPTSKGYVIEDRNKFKKNLVSASPHMLYMRDCPVWLCIDWGTGNCGIQVWQEQPGDRHVLLECEYLEETGPTEQKAKLLGYWNKYIDNIVELRGDLGGGGNYMNKTMEEEHGFIYTDVVFSEMKEAAARVMNIVNESDTMIVPEEFEVFVEQMTKWRRVNGRINKGNDHLCDTAICYFSRLIEVMGLEHIRIGPKVFDTNAPLPSDPNLVTTLAGNKDLSSRHPDESRIPIAIAFGGTRGR